MSDINNSYHYTASLGQPTWFVLNLVDGKCQVFPGTDTRRIVCENQIYAKACAEYYAVSYGGMVTRGGQEVK